MKQVLASTLFVIQFLEGY